MLNKSIKFAELDNLIDKFPKKLDTNIGYQGLKISGGQLQRIGIARALYQNPNILVLDEATNALDIETEKEIVSQIRLLKGNKTVIIISHNPNTIKYCNLIYDIPSNSLIINN